MLRQLWQGPEARASCRTTHTHSNGDMFVRGQEDYGNVPESTGSHPALSSAARRADQDSPVWDWETFGDMNSYFMSGATGQGNDMGALQTIEAHPFGSLWPGISDLWGQGAVQNSSWEHQDHQIGFEHTDLDF